MPTPSVSTALTPTRHFRLLAHTFLLISTNSLTLCLLYTLYISPSKQHLGFRAKLEVLQISWLIASGLVLVVSLCYLISSYYRGHKRQMAPAAAKHDVEAGARETGGEGEGGRGGRREETELIAGPPYELQLRPPSIFTRALGRARGGGGGGGRNPPSPTLRSEGGGMNVVREKERRHGPVYALQKPLPPDPPTDGDEDEQLRRADHWQQAPAAAVPLVVDNLSRTPQNAYTRPGVPLYTSYNTSSSAILSFEQVNVSSGGGPSGARVGMQGRVVDDGDGNNNESPGSQPLYANSELREVIDRYL